MLFVDCPKFRKKISPLCFSVMSGYVRNTSTRHYYPEDELSWRNVGPPLKYTALWPGDRTFLFPFVYSTNLLTPLWMHRSRRAVKLQLEFRHKCLPIEIDCFSPLSSDLLLNTVQEFSAYLTGNTIRPRYEDQCRKLFFFWERER
jgi:hypothetical protein